ncbi:MULTISPECIES: thioesterase family protein [Thermomonosporaceae]|uniref:thioesterase family protein n=1 Tax=Thermomonosporaceae TaxID=2012 RepID=UPI00255AD656|nr:MULTISPECIES: thioesterase family protein [Thermomonosporaceae]MDL4775666.1 thioesterase family protein [Actinomadura xylanilytica]
MSRFGDATAVTRLGGAGAPGRDDDGTPRRYAASLDPAFGFAEAINGGYLMAVLDRAAVDASPHEHPLSTATSFLRVAEPGPAEVHVEPRKTGRTVATSRVTLVQGGRPVVDALVTTGTLDRAAAADWTGEPPEPALPPIDACSGTEPAGDEAGFAGQVDMRFDPATMGWLDGNPSGRPEIRAWFRLRDPHEPDGFALALAVDALPPVVLSMGARGWAPTVELTWHMRAVPAPGWLAVHGGGRLVSGGWFDEGVEIWDSSGTLVAQSRQLARLGRGGPA